MNNDTLGTLAGALLFYLTIRVVNQTTLLLNGVSILLAVILPFTTKLTVLPVAAAVLAILAWKWFSGLRQRRWLVMSAVILVFGAGLLYAIFPELIQTAFGEISWRLFSLRKKRCGL